MTRRFAVDSRSAVRARCGAARWVAAALLVAAVARGSAVAAAADSPETAPASPQLPPSLLLFGDEHDPDRPIPPVLQPSGKGIVAATLAAAGPAQVLEYEGDVEEMTAVVVDVRIEAGSTTPDFTAASVHARTGGEGAAGHSDGALLLGACVLSHDASVTMTVAAGSRRAGWTVHIDDHEFLCADSSARLALVMPGGSFRLSAKAGGDAAARLLLVFGAKAAELKTLELPGATLKMEAGAPQ